MAVSYKKLFKLMIDRNMKKKELCQLAKVSPATISKLTNGDNVTMEVIDKICIALDCEIEDIVEIIPDNRTSGDLSNFD